MEYIKQKNVNGEVGSWLIMILMMLEAPLEGEVLVVEVLLVGRWLWKG